MVNPYLEEFERLNGNHSSGVSSEDTAALLDRIDELESQLKAVVSVMQGTAATAVQAKQALAAIMERTAQLEALHQRDIIIRVQQKDNIHEISGLLHRNFLPLLKVITSLEPVDRNVWLAGPAGGGKTTVCSKLASALGLPFEYVSCTDSKYDFSGYRDASGVYQDTAIYRIVKNGGVLLIDEVDGNSPGATLWLNGLTSNHVSPFPNGMLERHPDCYIIGAGNTWGFGGDANYLRNKLDAAFLDRFVTLPWPYDEALERAAAGGRRVVASQQWPDYCTQPIAEYRDIQDEVDSWIDVVQTVRGRAKALEAKVVISPRASIKGAQLLRGGCARSLVVEAIFGRYRSMSAWASFGQAAEDYAKLEDKPVVEPSMSVVPELTLPVPTFRSGSSNAVEMTAKFDGHCAACKKSIYRGFQIMYNPHSKLTWHLRCYRG